MESGGVEPIIAPADVDEYAIIEAMAGKPEAKIVEKLASAKRKWP